MAEANKRYAVVTGGNKGIGFGICKQLAENGVVVILTARDEKRGLDAAEKLKGCGLSDHIVFHQLDVTDSTSVASLVKFIETQFGKLDILVNNAGVGGVKIDGDALKATASSIESGQVNWLSAMTETYELVKECLEINYYGAQRMAEALVPLLQLSDSPRIVNIASSMGTLKNVAHEWAKEMLGDANNLSEERVDEVLNAYLNDFKEGLAGTKGWPVPLSGYILSKAALNAYTRILAKKYPSFCINSVCPGFVKTDINFNVGTLTVEEGAESPVRLALLQNGGPSGCFFIRKELTPF